MKIKCPACSKVLNVPDSAAGKVIKCPCGKQLKAPGQAATPKPAAPSAGAGAAGARAGTGRAATPRRTAPAAGGLDPAMFDELTDQDLQPVASQSLPGQKPVAASGSGNTAALLKEQAATAGGSSAAQFRRGPIASRGTRLVASILDGIFIAIMAAPVYLVCLFTLVPVLLPMFVAPEVMANLENLESLPPEEQQAAVASLFMGSVIASGISQLIAYIFPVILYAIMVTKSGQTLGKKCMKIRILDSDSGELPGFVNGVLIRGWAVVLLYCIPIAGAIFALVDICMIFREGNRCLHDQMAGTIVVES